MGKGNKPGTLDQFFGMALGCLISWEEKFRMTNSQRYELTSLITAAWFQARGRFFSDKNNPCYETSLYFDEETGVLYQIRSNEFGSFMATVSNVNREDKMFKFMMSLLDDLALDA